MQFDIRFYFGRRGCENMHQMKKGEFAVRSDRSGYCYICKRYDAEFTKNHREGDFDSSGDGYMPEASGNPLCPVVAFEKYVSKLSEHDRLWQQARASFLDNDPVWFTMRPVGEKVLGAFMPKLSVECNLSQRYTNHSVRATNATILKRLKFSDAQVCAVTGHKSGQSLAVYQRVSGQEKVSMGKALEKALVPCKLQRNFPCGSSSGAVKQKLAEVVEMDDWTDMDMTDFDTFVKDVAPSRPFYNCTFNNSNITVNINFGQKEQ